MSRKINLKALHSVGKLSASIGAGIENAQSDGIAAMFDDFPLTTKYEADHVTVPFINLPIVSTKLSFIPPIPGNKFRVITNIKGINSGSGNANIEVNEDHPSNEVILKDGSNPTEILQHTYDFETSGFLSTLSFSQEPPSGSTYDIEIFNIELFLMENTNSSTSFEFNDSVLTTHGWNSSRYDGKQLQAAKINEFTEGDTSYFGTPVVQNYSRNIYIGSRVIGMESGSVEDSSLLNFPGFSYVTVHEFITVNDDLSITKRTVRGDKPNTGMNNKKGFYQSWYDDFPIGSDIYLQLTDKKLAQSLKPTYRVYNNTGQLQKLLLVHKAHDGPLGGEHHVALYNRDSDPSTDPEDNAFSFATGSYEKLGSNFHVFNKSLLIDEFFSGSLVGSDIISTTSNPQGSFDSQQAAGGAG